MVPNQDAWHLFWDYTTLREIIDNLPGNSPLQNLALKTANEIMNEFDVEDPVSPNQSHLFYCPHVFVTIGYHCKVPSAGGEGFWLEMG